MVVLNSGAMFYLWRRQPLGLGAWFPVVIFFLLLYGIVLHLRRAGRAAEKMIISRAGVMLYSNVKTDDAVPWTSIQSASCSWTDGALCIQRPDGQEPIKFSHHLLGGTRAGKLCAAEINRLKVVYSPDKLGDHGGSQP